MEFVDGGLILVADGDAAVLSVSKGLLVRSGFEVITVVDGREAVDLFREHKDTIKAVILDLTMPNMGGEDTLAEMRKIRRNARIILMSGYNEQDVVQRFAGQGLAGFVQKPYQINNLSVALRRVFEK